MQTNTEDCYWALLSRKDFSFLYLSPWLSNNLKNESSDLLLGTSLFDYFRPDEKMLAQKDLTRVNNNKLSLSITRCHFSTISKIKRKLNLKFSSLSPTTSTFNNNNNNNNIINISHGYPYSSSSTSSSSSSSPQIRPISTTALDLSSSTNVDEYIVMDIGISLVSHDIILACFHSDDGRVHNGDKCSCGESFEFTQKTIDELNKCLNNKNSSSPNGSAIKFTTPPSTPHSEKFFSGNNPLFPPPPPSDRIFQIFDRKSKDLILTWPNPAISFTDNSNNTAYYNKNDFSKLILDCVNNDNKINNYNNYNTPNCLKATVHDKRLLLLSSSGSYGHVESLIIPYGNIIFASFQILSNTINPSSSKLSLTNNIGNGNFSESTPCSPTSTLKLTTPVCMTAVTGSSGDDYRSGDKRPRSLSPLLSISSLQQPQHHHTLYSKRHKMSSPNNNNNKLSLFPSQPRPLVVDDSAYNTSNPISSHHYNNNNDNNSQHFFPQQHYNNNNNNDNEKPSISLLQQPYFINHYNYNVYHHNNYQNHNNLHVHNNNNHNNLHNNHEVNDGDGDGSGNNTYPSPKSHNNNLPFISHNPSSSISSPQQSHSLAQNNNHHINHQYQQSLLLSSTTAATATTTTIPKSQKPNSSSLHSTRSPASSQRKNNNGLKECESCHTNTSPEWRRGPTGHKTLCNACGLRYSRTIARENRKKEQAQSEEEMRKREQRERDDMARERAQRMMDHQLLNNSHAFYYK